MKSSLMKFFAAITVAATAATASAKYLYSMVENASDIYNDNAPITFDYMTLSIVSTDGTKNNLVFSDGDGVEGGVVRSSYNENTGYYSTPALYAYISDDATFSHVIYELWNGSSDRVGWQTYTESQIANYVFGSNGGTGVTPLKVTNVIPEPTSGLMLLFGLAGLALRRKRA